MTPVDPASESSASDDHLIDDAWHQVAPLGRPQESEDFALEGYRILRLLHRGGQGVVYLALEQGAQRKVAIKVLRGGPLAGSSAAQRFEREVRILGLLDHPGVVRVRASGRVKDGRYYVMDYVAGRPLDAYVASEMPSARESVALLHAICEAVGAAHLLGVIHRDLKPANILIDEESRPRVVDFGLAKWTDAGGPSEGVGMTITGQFLGSMPWASPEQVEGRPEDVDVRTDVYSLGVILYQMLASEFPYPVVGSARNVMWNIVHAEPRPLSGVRPRVDDELQTIVRRCLAKERRRRYQSAGELGRDLERYLAGEPIEAKRDSTWYVLRKEMRRHPLIAALAGFATLLTLLAVVFLAIANRREAELRAEAQRQASIARAISTFLNEDLLAAVQPDGQGRDVTMREVLGVAAERIEGHFEDQPEVEAELRETLGETYMHLGDWSEAERHLQRALLLHRSVLGDEAPGTLAVLDLVARILRRRARHEESLELHREMVAAASRTLGEDHELTLRGRSNAAITLGRLGRYAEALDWNTPVLEARLRTLGEEHGDTLTSMNNQAHYLYRLHRFDQSLALNERVLGTRRRVLGDQDPETLVSMNNLAIEYGVAGRYADQEELLREALETGSKVLGEDHPDLVLWWLNLGTCLRTQGRLDEAHAILSDWLELARLRLGETSPRVGYALGQLAQLELTRGRYEEAEAHCLAARPVLATHLGPRDQDREHVELLLAEVYRGMGRFEEAEEILVEVHTARSAELGADHLSTLDSAARLVTLYRSWGKPERAENLRRSQ